MAPEIPLYHVFPRNPGEWVVQGVDNSRASATKEDRKEAVMKARDIVTGKGDVGTVFVWGTNGKLDEVQTVRHYQYGQGVDSRTLTDTGSF